jgi:hypothetical protein
MPKPTKVNVTIQENGGDGEKSRSSFYLSSSLATLALIEASIEAVVETMQSLITGDIIEVTYSKPVDISGYTLNPGVGEDTDRLVGGRFLPQSVDPFHAQVNLPTFDLAFLDGTSKNIDLADATVILFTDSLTGQSLTTAQDADLVTVPTAYRTFGSKK